MSKHKFNSKHNLKSLDKRNNPHNKKRKFKCVCGRGIGFNGCNCKNK